HEEAVVLGNPDVVSDPLQETLHELLIEMSGVLFLHRRREGQVEKAPGRKARDEARGELDTLLRAAADVGPWDRPETVLLLTFRRSRGHLREKQTIEAEMVIETACPEFLGVLRNEADIADSVRFDLTSGVEVVEEPSRVDVIATEADQRPATST